MESVRLRSLKVTLEPKPMPVPLNEPIEYCLRRGFRSQLELSDTLRLRCNFFCLPILCRIWSSIGWKNNEIFYIKRLKYVVWQKNVPKHNYVIHLL